MKDVHMKPWRRPYIDKYNILHYGKKQTYDISNETFQKTKKELGREDFLPKEVCKALLQTGEYFWVKGDRFNNYFAEVYHRCFVGAGSTDPCGNVSSNPCYGWIRDKKEDGSYENLGDCPRCGIIWALYCSYKPLKWKIWDWFISTGMGVYYFFHGIKKQIECFMFIHSKEGKQTMIQNIQKMNKGSIMFLTYWRRKYRKFILKEGYPCIIEQKVKDGWYFWDFSVNNNADVLEKINLENTKHNGLIPGAEVIWEA